MGKTIQVLIVDDSAFMRKSLSMMLESDPEIKVIGTARDGREAIEKIRQLKPDIVTLDIEMPVMDGLTALKTIMKEMPLPVLMVSSLTTEGAQATIDALALGAVDFIPKELSYVSLDISKIREELIEKVKNIARSRSLAFRLQRIRSSTAHIMGEAPTKAPHISGKIERRNYRAVALGVSTGGPMALLQIIPKVPANFPLGIAIVQHMPPKFTQSMASRLNSLSSVKVKEAEDGDALSPASVLIAPGGRHLIFEKTSGQIIARITDEPRETLYHPSADIMMSSIAEVINAPLIGVIMTGMGKDGLEGLKLIKQKEGYVVAQDEETCIVYGMPKAAVDEGVADAVVPLQNIPLILNQLVGLE
ncbi:MAG TPA: chemotaxis response regulator protein-glutamate methylesterase [Bacteroidota bacterium]|nr:chemotaxis response regulator protein-glutamate methylesterase [Bacteroidota bacterium]